MPLALQLVQIVLFTRESPSPFDLFPLAFGASPQQFQAAAPPAVGSVAFGLIDGRNLVLQVQLGRIDLFAASIDPSNPTLPPGQFSAVVRPTEAMDLVEAAATRVAGRCAVINRLAVVLRYAESVPDADNAVRRFSEHTGVPMGRLGAAENILQTGDPGTLENLPGSTLNRLRRWQTEAIYAINIAFAAGQPMAGGVAPAITHHAVTLNADANVIPADNVVPLPMVGDLLHRLRGIAIEVGGVALSEGEKA